ncbi:MAG: hypothetical protein ACFFDS_10385 [Candidatus Thorarchaeota archaeon]
MKLLLNNKPCRLLLAIAKQDGRQGITSIGKPAYATYKSRWEVISELQERGLVYTENMGREIIPYLTKKGELVLSYINYILSL